MNCCLCGDKTFEKMFDLGILPLGFPVNASQSNTIQIWKERLELVMCKRCFLAQTVYKVPSEKLMSENLYLSKHSKILLEHVEQFVSSISSIVHLSKDLLILEIGCGDGLLLERFQQEGFKRVIGIEPSIHLDKKYPFYVIRDFFNSNVVKELKDAGKFPGLVIANYVIELIPDLRNFFIELSGLMKKETLLVLEVPYLNDFFKSFRVDGFAHLRCNWFTASSLVYAFNEFGIEVIDIQHDKDYRGGTLRAIGKKHSMMGFNNRSIELIKKEKEALNTQFFNTFRNRIFATRNEILSRIKEIGKDISIYGYGGGVKASTLLNWLGVTSKEIKKIVDNDPNKQYRHIPIANIPIMPIQDLLNKKHEKIAVIILAIDHVNEVEQFLLQNLGKGSMIIHLLPEFRTIMVE